MKYSQDGAETTTTTRRGSIQFVLMVLTLAILVPIFVTIASLDGAKQSCRTDDRVPLDGMVVFHHPPKAAAAGYSLIARSGMGVPVLNGST